MKTVRYQGWTNPQTWCVALAFNSKLTIHDQALDIVNSTVDATRAAALLRSLGLAYIVDIKTIAPWAWENGKTLSTVNWDEIKEHFRLKLEEMR